VTAITAAEADSGHAARAVDTEAPPEVAASFCGGLPPRTERRNLAGRQDQWRQIGSLRKKKSPALVSGAEDDDRSSFLSNKAIRIRAIGSSKRLL
jgi:hypothetical protein